MLNKINVVHAPFFNSWIRDKGTQVVVLHIYIVVEEGWSALVFKGLFVETVVVCLCFSFKNGIHGQIMIKEFLILSKNTLFIPILPSPKSVLIAKNVL